MDIGAADWDEVVRVLKGAASATVACHVNPDGDALGSLLATALLMRKGGASVTASWAGEVTLPPSYDFLPGAEFLVPPGEVEADEVFVALDCGDLDRLGSLATVASECKTLINIDHHPGNPGFGKLNIVATTTSSTAELVAALADRMGIGLDDEIAVCLYTGIVTDTGCFQYPSTSPKTLELAARLRSFHFDAAAIAQKIYESASFVYLKLVGRMLSRAELMEDERFVYSFVTQGDLEELGMGMAETENLIDAVRSIRDADVAAMFKQQDDGRWRVSLRSKGAVSVGAIARAGGGGGHELAAGFTADSVEAGVEAIVGALRR